MRRIAQIAWVATIVFIVSSRAADGQDNVESLLDELRTAYDNGREETLAVTHGRLADALSAAGRRRDALAHYTSALSFINSNVPPAYELELRGKMANVLLDLPDLARAKHEIEFMQRQFDYRSDTFALEAACRLAQSSTNEEAKAHDLCNQAAKAVGTRLASRDGTTHFRTALRVIAVLRDLRNHNQAEWLTREVLKYANATKYTDIARYAEDILVEISADRGDLNRVRTHADVRLKDIERQENAIKERRPNLASFEDLEALRSLNHERMRLTETIATALLARGESKAAADVLAELKNNDRIRRSINTGLYHNLLLTLARLYIEAGDFNAALQHSYEAADYKSYEYVDIGLTKNADALLLSARAEALSGNLDTAEKLLTAAERIYLNTVDSHSIGRLRALEELSFVYIAQRKYEQAISLDSTIQDLWRERRRFAHLDDQLPQFLPMLNRAWLLIMAGDTEQGQSLLRSVRADIKRAEDKKALRTADTLIDLVLAWRSGQLEKLHLLMDREGERGRC